MSNQAEANGFRYMHHSTLVPNPANLRRHVTIDAGFLAMAASIKEHGVVEALVGIPLGDQDPSRAMLVCGHLRLRCVQYLVEQGELTDQHPHCWLPIRLEPDMPPERQQSLMFVENEHRVPISPVDEGLFYQSLLEQGWTKSKIALRLKVSQTRVNNRLDIVALAPEIQAMFLDDRLPIWSAGDILSIDNEGDRLRLARMLAGRQLALGRIKALCEQVAEKGIDSLLAKKPPAASAAPPFRQFTRPRGINPDDRIGLAALRAGVLAACRTCDAAPAVALPSAVTGGQVEAAADDVCCTCPVRDLADACAVCPLVAFLESLSHATT